MEMYAAIAIGEIQLKPVALFISEWDAWEFLIRSERYARSYYTVIRVNVEAITEVK